MKFRSLFFSVLCTLTVAVSLTACSDDEDGLNDDGSKVVLPARRAYILNEGAWGGNNAGIAFYAPNGDASFVSDIYYTQNGARLGDLANAILEHNDEIYVIVGGSKYVSRLNSAGVEQVRHAFTSAEGEPRCMDAEGDYLYVTQYGGKVSKLNAKTLDVVATYQGGDNLEGIVEEDGKLYVSNAYSVDGSGYYVYNKEVLVIDAATMTLDKSIEVVENPADLYEIDDKIYLLSTGNYFDVSPALQRINADGTVTQLVEASKITEGNNGLLYCINSAYDENWNMVNTFFTFNLQTGAVGSSSFLKNAPESFSTAAIYLLEVDEETGDIYVGTTDYITNGEIYRFDRNGTLTENFDAGGVNPSQMIFID